MPLGEGSAPVGRPASLWPWAVPIPALRPERSGGTQKPLEAPCRLESALVRGTLFYLPACHLANTALFSFSFPVFLFYHFMFYFHQQAGGHFTLAWPAEPLVGKWSQAPALCGHTVALAPPLASSGWLRPLQHRRVGKRSPRCVPSAAQGAKQRRDSCVCRPTGGGRPVGLVGGARGRPHGSLAPPLAAAVCGVAHNVAWGYWGLRAW